MRYWIFILFLFTSGVVLGQQEIDPEETFLDADSWFFYEEYKEALPLFLRVLEEDSINHNVSYKIGICYLNIDGQKEKAIPYLEDAIKNTTPNYRENSYNEDRAPLDAYFYLGNAYLINNQLSKAKQSYQKFREIFQESQGIFTKITKDSYDLEYLDMQIRTCDIATKLRSEPVEYSAVNVGSPINTRFTEYNAVTSGDGQIMVFTASLQFYDAIFFVKKKEDGEWGFPINIMGQLGVDDKTTSTSLSYDGTELYLYRDDDFDGNIYVSTLKDGIWSRVEKLNENINTKYWESHASISPDGKKLFFASNREGGFGDLDIYVSERTSGNNWGVPKNLGSEINTRWNENTPFLSNNGEFLFFSSEGHEGMGGYDVYYSHLKNNTWTNPVNVGYPINNTDDNLFFSPSNGSYGYYSQFSKRGYGGRDIFRIQLFMRDWPKDIAVQGHKVLDNPKDRNLEDYFISIVNLLTEDTISVFRPDNKPKEVILSSNKGVNHLTVEKPLTGKDGKQYMISQNYNIIESFVNPHVEEEVIAEAQETGEEVPSIKLEQKEYIISSDKDLKIKLNLLKGNKLSVSTFMDDRLLNSEEFDISSEDFVYEFKPVVGESKIRFQLVDDFNNVKEEEVSVSYYPAVQDKEAKLAIDDQIFDINEEGKNVKIKLSVEKNAELFIETFVDGKLISSESFEMDAESFVYEFAPDGDKTKINFKLVDKNNNVKNEEVVISHRPIENDLTNLLGSLNTYNSSAISALLASPELNNQSTVAGYLNTLLSIAAKNNVSPLEVNALLLTHILDKNPPVESFIKKLINSADGKLKDDLEEIFENKSDFKDVQEVISYVYTELSKKGYSMDEINQLLVDYICNTETDVDTLKGSLNQIATIVPVSIFSELDSDAIDITTVDELIAYLQSKGIGNTKNQGLVNLLNSPSLANQNSVPEYLETLMSIANNNDVNVLELNELFLAHILNTNPSVDDFKKNLIGSADGKLKSDLEEIFANSPEFENINDAINYVYKELGKRGHTIKEINKLLANYISLTETDLGSLKESFEEITENTPTSIYSKLDSKNAEQITVSEFINNIQMNGIAGSKNSELINFLSSNSVDQQTTLDGFLKSIVTNAEKNNISSLELNELFLTHILKDNPSIEEFKKNLLDAAEGKMKSDLEEIFAGKSDFKDINELISYVYSELAKRGYTIKDINQLLANYIGNTEISLDALKASFMQIASQMPVSKFSSIEPDSIDSKTIAQFVKYLERRITLGMKDAYLIDLLEALTLSSKLEKDIEQSGDIVADDISDKDKDNKWLYGFGALFVFILLIILLNRRKKKNKN